MFERIGINITNNLKNLKKSLLVPIAIIAVLIVAFLWVYCTNERKLDKLEQQYQLAVLQKNTLETKQNELNDKLEYVNTDAFIENEAREKYGYMTKDEVVFGYTNPEVLYEDNDD